LDDGKRTEGGIGRVWFGRKREQKGWRGLGTSLRRKRKIELRCLNRILKEKLHCIHHNELNRANSPGEGNMGTHSRLLEAGE
jgi:hypothetical protein